MVVTTLTMPSSFNTHCYMGSGKKSSNRRKSLTFFHLNFFPEFFLGFIWKHLDYKKGRPLILKLIPNDEEWNNHKD